MDDIPPAPDQSGTKTGEETAPPRFISTYLPYLLAAATDAITRPIHEEARAEGLRVVEWRVLACLIDRDGDMVTRLAQFALIEQSHLSKIVAHMAEQALVRRETDPSDGRRVRVFLEPKGRALAERLTARAQLEEARFDPALRAILVPALTRFLASQGIDVTGTETGAPTESGAP